MQDRYKKEKKLIEKTLRRYLDSFPSASARLKRAMEYALFSGGKRIRPILVLESCRACGGRVKQAIPVACAIELIHNFSLVHDDLPALDNDSFRRGKPACHKKFGPALALLAGNALLNLAYGLLARIKDKKVSQLLTKEISDAIGAGGMIGGQALDIWHKDKRTPEGRRDAINRLKTASLFVAALKTGAIASDASPEKVLKMQRFGAKLGFAFQIADDIIDKTYHNGALLEEKRREVKRFIENAKTSLKDFGKKADDLKDLADFIVNPAIARKGLSGKRR